MTLTLKKSSSDSQKNLSIKKKKIRLFIAGIGAVGGTLTKLIQELNHDLYDLRIIGVCTSSFTKWNPDVDAFL